MRSNNNAVMSWVRTNGDDQIRFTAAGDHSVTIVGFADSLA